MGSRSKKTRKTVCTEQQHVDAIIKCCYKSFFFFYQALSFELSTMYTECLFRCLKIESWQSYTKIEMHAMTVFSNVSLILHTDIPNEFREKFILLTEI